MVVLFHVLVALLSTIAGGLAVLRPNANLIKASLSLVALAVASGTYLVISRHLALLSVCLTGLVYLSVVGFELGVAVYRQREAE